MNEQDINDVVQCMENIWLENFAAREYLREHCGASDPTELLNREIQKIPASSLARIVFRPIRQVLGQGLQDSEAFSKLHEAILEALKQLRG